jgi:hypothetical protein
MELIFCSRPCSIPQEEILENEFPFADLTFLDGNTDLAVDLSVNKRLDEMSTDELLEFKKRHIAKDAPKQVEGSSEASGMLQNRDLFVFVWFSDHRGLVVFLHFAVVLVFRVIFIVGISRRRRGVDKALPNKKALRHT